MKNKSIFFCDPNTQYDLSKLVHWCENEQFEIVRHDTLPDYDSICSMLPMEAAVVFLPAIEKDCEAVKLAQNISEHNDKNVVVLYSQDLPEKDFLCMAFRMGIDDAVSLNSRDEAIEMQIRRARKLLQERSLDHGNNGELLQKVEQLTVQCQDLQRHNAQWQERLVSLATSASRIASGQMNLNELSPHLMVVASSESQARNAKELAGRMGFVTRIAHSGEEAIDMLAEHKPRVILTDGTLVDMDTISFAKTARKVLGDQPVIIIAWSSTAGAEEKLLAPDGGIDDFILKSSGEDKTHLLSAALLGSLR